MSGNDYRLCVVDWNLVIHPEVRRWLHSWRKDRRTAEQIAAAITYVLDNGPQAGRRLVDTIVDSNLKRLKELRPGSSGRSELRLLMIFDEGTNVVLLVAGDKAGNWSSWYRKAIPLAEDRYEAFKKGQW